jgi:Kelch motif protein
VRWLAALALCACSGTTGTVEVTLVTAPGSHVLDPVQTLRLTITTPRQVAVTQRTASGFDLALELDATGANGALIVEGLDATGTLVACGQSPAFPVAAINARIVVYIAAPRSVALAPVGLGAARSEVSGTSLGYGVVLAGGRGTDGAPTSDIGVYNSYDHTFTPGVAMPAARAGVAMAAASTGAVYLFGGSGPDGSPTGTLWRFDTTVAPSGAFTAITEHPELARTAQLMVLVPSVDYVITGTPALSFDGATLAARADLASLPAAGAGATTPSAVFVGDQLLRDHKGAIDVLPGDGRARAAAATLPNNRIVVLGGGEPLSHDALSIDAENGTVTVVPGVLQTGRASPAIAVTSRYVVVAGGTDAAGAPIPTAELLDATTLASIATLPIAARSGSFAVALPTDQVLIAGGTPASADVELFTPEPPAP